MGNLNNNFKIEKDINNLEEKILFFWEKNKIFLKSLQNRKNSPLFSFFDGPPFATGLPHYGHILASTIKDVFCRYNTMKGYYVFRRWGWDCHGLPIEALIEKEKGIKTKKEIEKKIGIFEFNKACRDTVLKFASEWEYMVKRIARWIEFRNSYKTMDTSYIESVWWAFKQFWDKEMIYEGKKPLLYCPRCETPVSKFEIIMDKNYKNVTIDSLIVKFEIIDSKKIVDKLNKKVFLLVWTTTPWTLPGNIALAVNPKLKYLILEEDDYYLISEESLSFLKLSPLNFNKYKRISGKELLALRYKPLFNINEFDFKDYHNVYRVLGDEFVSGLEGTGVVHLSPAYGEEDYILSKKYNLPVIDILDERGIFKNYVPGFLKGVYFENANSIIVDFLVQNNLLFKILKYTHKYPFCWRCGNSLYYRSTPSFFINIQKIKNFLICLNEDVNWQPKHLKYGRFLKSLKEAPDWNISRNRYWASPIPVWKCLNDSCGNTICIGSIEELRKRSINFKEVYPNDIIDLHRPQIDRIIIKCDKCNARMLRVNEVLDCWFESASMPFAEIHYPFENREYFEKRYPADFVAEYIAQTRAWFYVMMVVNGFLFKKAPFKNVITTGTILNEKGEKLSKSKKNFPDPENIIKKYGADALRFYLLSSQVVEARDLFFSEKEVMVIKTKIIDTILNLVKLFEFYSLDSEIKKISNFEYFIYNLKNIINKWILSLVYFKKKLIRDYLDTYKVRLACREIVILLEKISLVYLKLVKDLIKNRDEETIVTYTWVLFQFSKIIAPLIPFSSEIIYQKIHIGKKGSVHLENFEDLPFKVNKNILKNMDIINKIITLGLSIRKEHGIKLRYPLDKIYINLDLPSQFKEILKKSLNAKQIIVKDLSKIRSRFVVIKNYEEVAIGIKPILNLTLIKEGILKDIIRVINFTRKQVNLLPRNLTKIIIYTDNPEIIEIINCHKEEIFKSTYSNNLEIIEKLELDNDLPIFKIGDKKQFDIKVKILHYIEDEENTNS